MNFKDTLRVEVTNKVCNGRIIYRLLEGFAYEPGDKFGSLEIIVPKGFETDFASIPRFFWRIFPPAGRYAKAAVIHDYLYVNYTGINKKDVDYIFWLAMKESCVPAWKRWCIWKAVDIFGRVSW